MLIFNKGKFPLSFNADKTEHMGMDNLTYILW